jgi:hypothetical protein
VNVDDFFVGYNQVVADLCGCAGLTGDLFTQDPVTGAWSGSCGDTSACTLPEEEGCFDLVDTEPLICPGIPFIITGVAADLDFDGDGVYEALSVGLQISGPPGEIVGISF